MPYFPAKKCSRSYRDMVANFWTATTAWFYGGTGSNSEDSPCPSVTSYWCSVQGFYLTVFEHWTPLGKPPSRPSVSNHNFLSNSLWGAWQSRWCPNCVINMVNFLHRTHLWASPLKHSDTSGVTSKLKLLWLGSTKPPNFKKIGLAELRWNPTNLLQSWPVDLKIWAARGLPISLGQRVNFEVNL